MNNEKHSAIIINSSRKLSEELCTMKIMLASLYKSISEDKNKKGLIKWEQECNKIAKKYITNIEKEMKDKNNE